MYTSGGSPRYRCARRRGIEEWETTILHFGREELLWGVVVGGGVNR